MRNLLLTMCLLLGSVAMANGQAKLTWNHDGSSTDGTIVPITAFTIYYGPQGGALNKTIQIGPPAPLPWKVVGAMKTWSKTLTDPAWVPGASYCFAMSAWSFSQESSHSNQVCKTFTSNPNEPTIIDIIYP